jgi:hypothetical protein
VRATIRAEHLDGHVHPSKSLERARFWYRDVPRDVPQTVVTTQPDPSEGLVPSLPVAKPEGLHGPEPRAQQGTPSSPPERAIHLPFANGIQREAVARASLSVLTNSLAALRTSVDHAYQAQPPSQPYGPAPSFVLALQAQMSLVADALTELAVLANVLDAQAPQCRGASLWRARPAFNFARPTRLSSPLRPPTPRPPSPSTPSPLSPTLPQPHHPLTPALRARRPSLARASTSPRGQLTCQGSEPLGMGKGGGDCWGALSALRKGSFPAVPAHARHASRSRGDGRPLQNRGR